MFRSRVKPVTIHTFILNLLVIFRRVGFTLNNNTSQRKDSVMKKLIIAALALMTSTSALAIDQVILSNGEIVEGKVLSDVPNRHVDIQLINGNKRRFQRNEVASVERDVPSNKDTDTYGSDRRVYFGLNAGGSLNFDSLQKDVLFNYGARFGVNVAQLGDFSKFAFGLAYNRSSQTTSLGSSASVNQLMIQLLFRKVANSGFYFGPELGLAIVSSDIVGLGSNSSTKFDIGALVGYDYYFSPSFSMGPEVHITHFENNTILKFLLGVTFHFE